MSIPPLQVAPISRPDIVEPHRVVELNKGGILSRVNSRMDLLHGANYNDPQYFRAISYAQAKTTA
jgi:cyanobactin biosynthesis protein (PatB/AcyB/McaB family)